MSFVEGSDSMKVMQSLARTVELVWPFCQDAQRGPVAARHRGDALALLDGRQELGTTGGRAGPCGGDVSTRSPLGRVPRGRYQNITLFGDILAF